MLPPPLDVARRIISDITSGEFFLNAAITLHRTLVGFGIAVAGGMRSA